MKHQNRGVFVLTFPNGIKLMQNLPKTDSFLIGRALWTFLAHLSPPHPAKG